jgi:pimeloyl-ACP methyl ester carboxylesterase
MMTRVDAALVLFALVVPPTPAAAVSETKLVAPARELGVGFDRFLTTDRFGRAITFYVSAKRDEKSPKPLAVFIGGSGCQSIFMKGPEGRIGGGLQSLLEREAEGRLVVMAVEKPGVAFAADVAQPGTTLGASEEYQREHTLPRWAEAVGAATRAASALPGVDASRLLVAGHSEGCIVAARVAAENPRVTHVGVLAGGGPSQLFEMAESARRPRSPDEPKEVGEKRVEAVYATWREILADPENATKTEWGHSYRRWSSFLAESPLDHLLATSARVFVAYGTEDASSPTVSNDVLRAELVRRERDVIVERRIGEDHGFSKPGDPPGPGGMSSVMRHLVSWFRE